MPQVNESPVDKSGRYGMTAPSTPSPDPTGDPAELAFRTTAAASVIAPGAAAYLTGA